MKKVLCLFIVLSATTGFAQSDTPGLSDYLDRLAETITADDARYASPEAWKASAEERRLRLARMLGLVPVPEKTPLNPREVGAPVELATSQFKRVVFESAPGIYVAAHLCLPKGVSFPAPAVLYVPGHSRRDRYLPHALAYAEKGFVALNMPMVGEEGKVDADAGKCGHYGPFHEQFDWLASGYTSAGAEVWDTVRAIDFLLTLKDDDGNKIVDPERIGIAGLSGGSARVFWTTAFDERIKAAVACQGFTTIANYDATIASTCDVHLFFNYYLQPYAEVYGNAAPRALRVIQATEDPLYKNPQPVADAMARVYASAGAPDLFSYVTFPGGHGYKPEVVAAEQDWLMQWLKPEKPNLPKPTAEQAHRFMKNRELLNDAKNLQCFSGDRSGWILNGQPVKAKRVEVHFTPKPPKLNLRTKEEVAEARKNLLRALKAEVLVACFRDGTSKLDMKTETLTLDGNLRLPCRLIKAEQPAGRTRLLLVEDLDGGMARAKVLTGEGRDVLLLQPPRMKNKHVRRYAALVGHTETSLAIRAARDAVAALGDTAPVDIEGKGPLAVAALFAALIEPGIVDATLEDCPETFSSDTALLGILRHIDLLDAVALLSSPSSVN